MSQTQTFNIDGRRSPLCLLSLDGGGIRGLSELIILEELMERIKADEKLDTVPIPADRFDLIGGTSTGGLIAILLGRLRFSAADAIETYQKLAKNVFSEKKYRCKDGTFKASKLEEAIKHVLTSRLGLDQEDVKMYEPDGSPPQCRAFVCALAASDATTPAGPALFRTYHVARNREHNCTIWEAARATSAAPTFFKRIAIGPSGSATEYVDAGIGCNNPIKQVVAEAARVFGKNAPIACILSIGTGEPGSVGFDRPDAFQRWLPTDLIEILKKIATDSEKTSEEMTLKYGSSSDIYHRLNVTRGLGGMSLAEWKNMGDVRSHTRNYLRMEGVSRHVDQIVNALSKGRASPTQGLSQLGRHSPHGPTPSDGVPGGQASDNHILASKVSNEQALRGWQASTTEAPSQPVFYSNRPNRMVHHLVLRQSLFTDIKLQLFGRKECPIVILQGTGGSGKTQLAIECCRHAEKDLRFIATFWIDASSTISVMRSYKAIASLLPKKVANNSNQEILVSVVQKTLRELQYRWLVVFDNYDNPTAFKDPLINYYIPTGRNGSILFTSRRGDSARLGRCFRIEVSKMTEQESRKLLLDGKPSNEEKEAQASRIASALGDIPLALDQAAAYIRSRRLPFRDFIPEYNKRKELLVEKMPGNWKNHMSMTEPEGEQALSVFTLSEMLLDLLGGTREEKHAKCRFLTLAAFFDNKLISERYFRVHCDAAKALWMGIFGTEELDFERMGFLLDECWRLSLVQMPSQRNPQPDEHQFSVHPLVCEWMKFRKKLDRQQNSIMEMAEMLTNYLRNPSSVDKLLHIRQETISHIDACILNEKIFCGEELNIGLTALSDSARRFASVYFEEGRYKQGKRLLEQGLTAKVKKFGLGHLETLNAINDVCIAYIDMGQPKEAETLLRLVVAACEKAHGTKHFETLRMVSNLAISYFEQERYSKAEKLFKRAVTSDDPATKTQSAFNLLNCYRVQGRYDEAISLYRDFIAPSESMMGSESLEKMSSRYYLGSCYHGQGRYDEAAKVYEEVLAKYTKRFGKEHSETQSVREDLLECQRSMNEGRGQ